MGCIMRNTLVKTLIIAALLLCSNLRAKANNCIVTLKKAKIQKSSNMSYNHQLARMYGLQKRENLKAYHVGSKFFDPSRKVPTAGDLVDSIKSHPYFIGSFAKEPSYDEYVSLKAKVRHPFFILETSQNERSDFYMVHSKGVRHFTINISNEKSEYMASLNNGYSKIYPNLSSFIKCTTTNNELLKNS